MKAFLKAGGLAVILIMEGAVAFAQFDSGSTGTEDLIVSTDTTIPLPEDGVLEYDNVTVQSGATLTFQNNSHNTGVTILAAGDVTIDGTINVSGAPGVNVDHIAAGTTAGIAAGGPGGFPGGLGAIAESKGGNGIGKPGGGPGGGAAATDASAVSGIGRAGNAGSHFTPGGVGNGNPNPAAPTYGDTSLLTLSGGSGGAGGNLIVDSTSPWDGASGGGGGGAILIAASGTITVNGSILANGGIGFPPTGGHGGGSFGSGGGAGGAVRLMASAVTGTGNISAKGASGAATGGDGLIRIESLSLSGTIGQNTNPPAAFAEPGLVRINPADQPSIQIVSIAGLDVSLNPTGSISSPDVIIPGSTANPVTIEIATNQIPDGSVIHLRIVLQNGEILTVDSTPVSGGSATAQATLPTSIGVIYATAEFSS